MNRMRSIMRHRIIVVFWIVATVGIGTILWNGSIPKKEYNTLSPIANMPDTPVETPQETGRGSGLSTTDLQNPVESYSISKQAGNGRMPAPCKWWKPSSTLGKLGCGCGIIGSFMVCYLLGIHLVKRRNKKICARFEQYTGFQLLDLGRYNADQRQAFEKALEEDQTILQHKTSPWSSNTFKKANEIHQAICSNQIKKINDTIKSQSTQNQRPVLPAQPFQKIDKSSTDYLGGFWVDVIKVLDEIEEMLTPKTVFSRCTQYFVALCKKHKKTPEERIKDFNHTIQLMHTTSWKSLTNFVGAERHWENSLWRSAVQSKAGGFSWRMPMRSVVKSTKTGNTTHKGPCLMTSTKKVFK
ncbi:MAG: hypothetical protein ACPGC9_00880 [Cytophagales bacterium]